MELFHVIEDGAAILRSRGVFRQCKIYRRAKSIYAGYGAGFIRLTQGGGTSVPNVSWVGVAGPGVDEYASTPTWIGLPLPVAAE